MGLRLFVLITVSWAWCTRGAQLPIRTFTTADGLPNDNVYCVIPDHQGLLWVCTPDGLARYDGYHFQVFGTNHGLPHRLATDVVDLGDGDLMVASRAGMARMDGQAPDDSPRKFTRVEADRGDLRAPFLRAIRNSDGTLWAVSIHAVYKLDRPRDGDARMRRVFELPGISAATSDAKDGLWLGSRDGLLVHLSSSGALTFDSESATSSQAQIRSIGPITTLWAGSPDTLWVGTSSGLWLFSAGAGALTCPRRVGKADGLPSEVISRITASSSNRSAWVATGLGLCELAATRSGAKRIQKLDSADGLPGWAVSSVAYDSGGNLWIGTDHGLTKMARRGFVQYAGAGGIGKLSIPDVIESRSGEVIAVSNEESGPVLHRFDGERFNRIAPSYGIRHAVGWGSGQIAIHDHAGEFWIATGSGLFRFPRVARVDDLAHTKPLARYTKASAGFGSDVILRVFESSNQDVWVGPYNSPPFWWRRATGRFERVGTKVFTAITAFAEDQGGDIWMAGFRDTTTNRVCDLVRRRPDGKLDEYSFLRTATRLTMARRNGHRRAGTRLVRAGAM